MTTGTIIIKRALQKIGAHSAVAEAPPEAIQTTFETLNAMISLWTSQGIMTGATLLEVPGDELNEKQDCQNAIIYNLAVMVAPDFDNGKQIVSPTLQRMAITEFNRIQVIYQSLDIPKKVVSSTLPRGQGNRRFLHNDAFFPEGSEIGN